MGNIVIPNTFSDSPPATNLIKAAEVNANFTAVTAQVNGNLENVNIKSGADIDGAKMLAASLALAKLVPLILYGAVNGSTGAILSAGSSGWSSSHSGTGQYTLSFSPVFSSAPIVVALASFGGGALTTLTTSVSGSSAVINTNLITAGNPGQDANFHFIAVGAR